MFFFFVNVNVQYENVLTTLNKVDALDTKFTQIYKQQTFKPYSVDGQVTGQYKNAGTFSYLRIYGAGHEVPAYKVCSVLFFFGLLLFFGFKRLMIYASLVNWIMVKLLLNFSRR